MVRRAVAFRQKHPVAIERHQAGVQPQIVDQLAGRRLPGFGSGQPQTGGALGLIAVWRKRRRSPVDGKVIRRPRIDDHRFTLPAGALDYRLQHGGREQTLVDVAYQHAVGARQFAFQPREHFGLNRRTQRARVLVIDPQQLLRRASGGLNRAEQAFLDDRKTPGVFDQRLGFDTERTQHSGQGGAVGVGTDY